MCKTSKAFDASPLQFCYHDLFDFKRHPSPISQGKVSPSDIHFPWRYLFDALADRQESY